LKSEKAGQQRQGVNVQTSEVQLKNLTGAAKAASENAYCRYSGFPVGAAVLTEDGSIFVGCNVENVSFGLSMCAERNAIFQAVAQQGKQVAIRTILIYTPTPTPVTPCGGCRQVIGELAPNAEIIMVCNGPDLICTTNNELLPDAFACDSLKLA
jgi:cytidine deaminase